MSARRKLRDTVDAADAAAVRVRVERAGFAGVEAGRLASETATILRGKHKPTYAPHVDGGDFVIVVNAGNGMAGPVIDLLEQHLPFEFIKIHHQPDGTFPNGIPNPLLPEGRGVTIDAIKQHGADLGVAWDGDFDRCFLFDETGGFIEGYYIVGLLAEAFLSKHQGSKIVNDL